MEAEDSVFDYGSEWKVVEKSSEKLPYVCISVFSQTLIVESINLGDLLTFVVSSENGDSARESDLQGN